MRYIEKSNRHLFQKRSMIYTFIRNNEKIFPIEKMCNVLQVGQRSYYQWKSGVVSDRKQRAELIKEKITSIYFDSKQRYGSPRMTAELASLGDKLSRITVAKSGSNKNPPYFAGYRSLTPHAIDLSGEAAI